MRRASLSTITAATLLATPALAAVCDYKPSRIADNMMTAASDSGATAAAGAGIKAVGHYALAHPGSSLAAISSSAAGASAAGTTLAGILAAPATIIAGAITVVAAGAYEGVCYFAVDRVDDPFQVYGIVESIADTDPAVSIAETDGGPAMVIDLPKGPRSFLIRRLYVADGMLMHRDALRDTKIAPVAYVQDEEPAAQITPPTEAPTE